MNEANVRLHFDLNTVDKKNKNPWLSRHIEIEDRKNRKRQRKRIKKRNKERQKERKMESIKRTNKQS
jgi:hypothetical protein